MSRILDSIDIVIFVAVLAGAVWLLGTRAGLGLEEKDRAVAAAETARLELEKAVRNATYETDEGHHILKRLLEVPEEVDAQWSPPTRPRPYVAGIFYHPESVDDVRNERELEVRFPAPEKLDATSDIGRIRLTWQVSGDNTVKIRHFEVYRRQGDQERLLATVPGNQQSFVDDKVEAGTLYSYRLIAVTDDRTLVRSKRHRSPHSRAVDIRGARDYQLKLVIYDPATRKARVQVRRHVNGVWHEKVFDFQPGKKIGALDAGSGINYATPCQAVRLEQVIVKIPEERDEVTFDGSGRVVLGANGKPETRHVTYERRVKVVKAHYVNELGEPEVLGLRLGEE